MCRPSTALHSRELRLMKGRPGSMDAHSLKEARLLSLSPVGAGGST